jgi:hypothetical protein
MFSADALVDDARDNGLLRSGGAAGTYDFDRIDGKLRFGIDACRA